MSKDAAGSRALLKGYLVRILNHKYQVAATKLDILNLKLH